MKAENTLIDRYFRVLQEENIYSKPGNISFYCRYLFYGVNFEKKKILDIGGGSGVFSYYAACRGAAKAVCLEPEASGATTGIIRRAQTLGEKLGLNNVSIVPRTLQEFDPSGETFDIILLHNSVNHLNEDACVELHKSTQAAELYMNLFRKIFLLCANNSMLVAADCARLNLYPLLGMKNPFSPKIEWQKHQSPYLWAKLFRKAGFSHPVIRWTSPSPLRKAGAWLFGNPVASFFINSHFCLTMRKNF